MILINVTLINSNISLSYINSSVIIGSLVGNSLVFYTDIFNSTIINSTLSNVTLSNCRKQHNRIIQSKNDDKIIFPTTFVNLTRDYDARKDLIIMDKADKIADDSYDKSQKGVNIVLMVFGILGAIILVASLVVGSLLSIRYVVKKKQDMSLVRSAVMGNVKSW